MSRQVTRLNWFKWLPRNMRTAAVAKAADSAPPEQTPKEDQGRLRREYESWLAVARDPTSPPEDLRRLVTEYAERLKSGFPAMHAAPIGYGPDLVWQNDVQAVVCANPNLPLDLFGTILPINERTIRGFLANPICPLVLLERPDFVEALPEDGPATFAHLALRQSDLPPYFLRVLARSENCWTALEARTHLRAEFEDGWREPDLRWLDKQVIDLLRNETRAQRMLVFELASYGLLSPAVHPGNPWLEADARTRHDDTYIAEVEECVRHAQAISERGPTERLEWRARWVVEAHSGATMPGTDDGFFYSVLAHPDVPFWVAHFLANTAPINYRFPASQHPHPTLNFMAECRRKALHDALFFSWGPARFHHNCPGTLYLVLRDLADPFTGTRLNVMNFDIEVVLVEAPFLARLAVALRLDDSDEGHRRMRYLLLDDPNRYVRAAARREIVWPNPAKASG